MSDRLSSDWRPPSSRPQRAPATGDEIERALVAAERLLVEGGAEGRHLQNMRFGAVSLLIVTTLSMIGAIIGFVRFEAPLILPAVLLVGVPIGVWLIRLALRPTRDVTTELAAQIAGMVDEAMAGVAEREGWSHLRVQATRLRLSAFPIPQRAGEARLAGIEYLRLERDRRSKTDE